MDAGLTAHCLVTELGEEVAKIDRFCAFASTQAMVAMGFGIGVSGRFECRSIRVGV